MVNLDKNQITEEEKELQLALLRKAARKAKPGDVPRLFNIPRNWLHQGLRYMDTGEMTTRLFIVVVEFLLVCLLLVTVLSIDMTVAIFISFLVVQTWNWVTNGLFWAVIIFTFPWLRNPGAKATVTYLNDMRTRLEKSKCIVGVSIYGSVTRGRWHDRSDIDIRFLRKRGISNLLCAALITMKERFIAFVRKQPMDLFLADNIEFLKKMRSDEVPVLTLCRDQQLQTMYPQCAERKVYLSDLIGESSQHEN